MKMKLEVVIVPVSDVDRPKAFYEKAGVRGAVVTSQSGEACSSGWRPNFLPAVVAMVALWFRFLPPPCPLPLLSHCRE